MKLIVNLLIISATKLLVIGFSMVTLAGGAIGTGVLFSGYILGAAKNPEESESLFSTALIAFAFIETFVFIALGVSFGVYFVL